MIKYNVMTGVRGIAILAKTFTWRMVALMLMSWSSVSAQKSLGGDLELMISDQSLSADSASGILTINLTFINRSDRGLIVYGLSGDLQAAPVALTELCRPDVGTGMAIALYQKDGTQEMPMVNMAAYSKVKDKKMPDSVRRAGELEFVKSKIVVAKGEELHFTKVVPISDFYLEKGAYDIEVIYYCGQKISDVVNVKTVNKGSGVLYQGCALSHRIPVVIR